MANLKDLGEFGVIERLSKNFKHQANDTILPLGDDCAVYSTSPSKIPIDLHRCIGRKYSL